MTRTGVASLEQGFVAKECHELEVTAGRILVEIDEAALFVALSLFPSDLGAEFIDEEIINVVNGLGVRRGLDPDEVRGAVLNSAAGAPVERVLIATGRMPIPGRDAYLEYPQIHDRPGERIGQPDACLFCQKHVINVLTGQQVGIFHAPDEGINGINVRDEPIPVKPGQDHTPKPGPNATWDDTAIVATDDGRLVIDEQMIYIDPILRFEESLTPACGDVDFVGHVVVQGNVEAGVRIHCRKNVRIAGSLIGTELRCEGDLEVTHGIIGSDETTIRVDGDLSADFIENARLKVQGTCTIRNNFVTSSLLCGKALRMDSGRGLFVSGTASAREGMKIQTVGVPEGTPVHLRVGRNIIAEEALAKTSRKVNSLAVWLEETQELEEEAGPATESYEQSTPAQREMIDRRLKSRTAVEEALHIAQDDERRLQKLALPLADARVTVLRDVHAHTVIEFPHDRLRTTETLRGVMFLFDRIESQIMVVSLNR